MRLVGAAERSPVAAACRCGQDVGATGELVQARGVVGRAWGYGARGMKTFSGKLGNQASAWKGSQKGWHTH